MKNAYPILMSKSGEFVLVYVPDFDIFTQGRNNAEAIEMARDAIGLMGIDLEDDGKTIPDPQIADSMTIANRYCEYLECVAADCYCSLVDVDFFEYRKRNNMKTVRRNVSLPCWLDFEAEKAGINVSYVLQNALKKELGLANS